MALLSRVEGKDGVYQTDDPRRLARVLVEECDEQWTVEIKGGTWVRLSTWRFLGRIWINLDGTVTTLGPDPIAVLDHLVQRLEGL